MIFLNRDRESLGQFTAQEVANGLESGRFLPTDLAWREGMETWQPLATFQDLPPANPAPAIPTATLEKPVESLPTGKIRFDECLSKAWECFLKNWGLMIVASLIFFALSIIIQLPMQFSQIFFEQFGKRASGGDLGILIGMGLVFFFFYAVATGGSSILSAGLMVFFIDTLRTGTPELGTVFAGFREFRWLHLLLATLVWIVTVFLIVFVATLAGVLLSKTMDSQIPIVIATVLAALPIIYFSVGIGFVYPLIVDKDMKFHEAIPTALTTVHRQWWQAFGLLILAGLITLLGLLACCVGLLATGPIASLIWGQAYRQLFGDNALPSKRFASASPAYFYK